MPHAQHSITRCQGTSGGTRVENGKVPRLWKQHRAVGRGIISSSFANGRPTRSTGQALNKTSGGKRTWCAGGHGLARGDPAYQLASGPTSHQSTPANPSNKPSGKSSLTSSPAIAAGFCTKDRASQIGDRVVHAGLPGVLIPLFHRVRVIPRSDQSGLFAASTRSDQSLVRSWILIRYMANTSPTAVSSSVALVGRCTIYVPCLTSGRAGALQVHVLV